MLKIYTKCIKQGCHIYLIIRWSFPSLECFLPYKSLVWNFNMRFSLLKQTKNLDLSYKRARQHSPISRATCKSGSWVRYSVWQHTFVSPSAFSRRAVVSYWRKYVHEVLVNRLGGLSLSRKSVVRLTDRPDMTLNVYRGRKTTIQQQLVRQI